MARPVPTATVEAAAGTTWRPLAAPEVTLAADLVYTREDLEASLAYDEVLFCAPGRLRILSAEEVDRIPPTMLRILLHRHGIYCLPTQELVDYLGLLLGTDRSRVLEIGAGAGHLGRALMLPRMSDARVQARPEIAAWYRAMGQPPIAYPDDVLKMEAEAAVERYRPQTVIAAWVLQRSGPGDSWGVPHGVRFEQLLEQVPRIIFIGSWRIHRGMRILWSEHRSEHRPEIVKLPGLRSRSPIGNDFVAIWSHRRG